MMKQNHAYLLHLLPTKLSRYVEEAPAVYLSAEGGFTSFDGIIVDIETCCEAKSPDKSSRYMEEAPAACGTAHSDSTVVV